MVKGLTTVKQGKATTIQNHLGKCLTEEREILNRPTEYCSEQCNHKANGDPSVLNYSQTDTEDDHHILYKEVEAALQSLKKGKSRCYCTILWLYITVDVRHPKLLPAFRLY